MNIIKAERATVKFFDGLEVDGYMMPDGEFRVSLSGASVLLGFAPNFLSRAISRGGTALESLTELGFEPSSVTRLVLPSEKGKGDTANSISIDDLNALLIYAAQKGKKPAIALQKALARLSLVDFFRDAFSLSPLSIEQKRKEFYKAYAASISPEDWMFMDKEDIARLALPGDPEELYGWNE